MSSLPFVMPVPLHEFQKQKKVRVEFQPFRTAHCSAVNFGFHCEQLCYNPFSFFVLSALRLKEYERMFVSVHRDSFVSSNLPWFIVFLTSYFNGVIIYVYGTLSLFSSLLCE